MGRDLLNLGNLGMSMGNLSRLHSNPFGNPALYPFSKKPVLSFPRKSPGMKPDRRQHMHPEEEETEKEQTEEITEQYEEDGGMSEDQTAEEIGKSSEETGRCRERRMPDGKPAASSINLQEAVVWAEILGDPVSRKRRKTRMRQGYGNQGYAGRR